MVQKMTVTSSISVFQGHVKDTLGLRFLDNFQNFIRTFFQKIYNSWNLLEDTISNFCFKSLIGMLLGFGGGLRSPDDSKCNGDFLVPGSSPGLRIEFS